MSSAIHVVPARALTHDSWKPFGWIPVEDTDEADGLHHLSFEWSDPHLNVISHAPEEIEHSASGLICTRLYRHDTHTQALMVLDSPSVIAVAPSSTGLDTPADLGAICAFRLEKQEVFVLYPGTWHWGPFPVGDRAVHLLNLQGFGYRDDNRFVDLKGLGGVVEVTWVGWEQVASTLR